MSIYHWKGTKETRILLDPKVFEPKSPQEFMRQHKNQRIMRKTLERECSVCEKEIPETAASERQHQPASVTQRNKEKIKALERKQYRSIYRTGVEKRKYQHGKEEEKWYHQQK